MPGARLAWTLTFLFSSILPAAAQARSPLATCAADAIDPVSYSLTTRAQAHILTEQRGDWWDAFGVPGVVKAAATLRDLNLSSAGAAEEAIAIDSRNLLAHGILARQYVTVGEDAALADRAWQTVLDNGGAVTWTATLHDVDYKSYFVVAFDRDGLRLYRYGELAGPYEKMMGMPRFVGAERDAFYRALGGCIDPSARPEAVVPWRDVREIKGGNYVIWFKLARPVSITSDNRKRRTGDEIKVGLHGAIGHVDVLTSRDSRGATSMRPMGIGPFEFQQRVRYTLVKHVDPAGRIKLPQASRSAGW